MKLIDALDQSPVLAYKPKLRLNVRRRTQRLIEFTDRPRVASWVFFCMLASILLSVLLMSGCQTLNNPTTFNEKVSTGYASLAAVRSTTTDLLIAKRIDVTTAVNIQMQADNVRSALDTARIVYKDNNSLGATDLDKALATILTLQSTLNTLKGTP
jgi:hypothetical protein